MLAGTFSILDLDLDLAFWKRTWTRTWTCPLKVYLDLDLRIVDLDLHLDLAVAGLVTSLIFTQADADHSKCSKITAVRLSD